MPVGMFHSVLCSEQRGGRFSEVSITLSSYILKSIGAFVFNLSVKVGERPLLGGSVMGGSTVIT